VTPGDRADQVEIDTRPISSWTRADYATFYDRLPTQWPMREWARSSRQVPGPLGLCWHNARTYAATDPDRYAYAEGLVTLPALQRREPHGWVVDRTDDSVVEVTSHYEPAFDYRGLVFDVRAVEAWLDEGDRRAEGTNELPVDSMWAYRPLAVVRLLLWDVNVGEMTMAEFARTIRRLLDWQPP
jgi:hypothetical protein